MKRTVKAIRSKITGMDVEIVPSIELEEETALSNGNALDRALEALAEIGIYPIRITHGTAIPEDQIPAVYEEVALASRRVERQRIIRMLRAEVRSWQAMTPPRNEAAAALAMFALALSGKDDLRWTPTSTNT